MQASDLDVIARLLVRATGVQDDRHESGFLGRDHDSQWPGYGRRAFNRTEWEYDRPEWKYDGRAGPTTGPGERMRSSGVTRLPGHNPAHVNRDGGIAQGEGVSCRQLVMAVLSEHFMSSRWSRFVQVPDRSLLLGAVTATAGIALLDGGIAWSAQQAGLRFMAAEDPGSLAIYSVGMYSVGRHVAAMVLLAALTVAVSVVLARAGHRGAAVAVLAAVVAGPMTVIAAPVSAALIAANDQDTLIWWHLVVGVPQFAVLAGVTVWSIHSPGRAQAQTGAAVRAGAAAGTGERAGARPGASAGAGSGGGSVTAFAALRGKPAPVALLTFSGASVFGVFVAAAITGQIVLTPNVGGGEHPGLLVIVGWAVLGAAIAAIVAGSSRVWLPAVALVAGVVVLGSLYWAYCRWGGWPGVAGWEFAGMQSPVILSPGSSLTLLAGPLLGLAVQGRRATAVLGRRYPPALPQADAT